MTELTQRQRQILDAIVERWVAAKPPPTLRELGDAFGIASTNGVSDTLKRMEKKGAIRRTSLHSRGIELVLEHPDVAASVASAKRARAEA